MPEMPLTVTVTDEQKAALQSMAAENNTTVDAMATAIAVERANAARLAAIYKRVDDARAKAAEDIAAAKKAADEEALAAGLISPTPQRGPRGPLGNRP